METIIIGGLTLLSGILFFLLLLKKRSPGDNGMLQMGKRLEQLDRLARQVEEMNTIFHSPRLRGGLGETLLEELIRNRLPRESYSFQHSFSGGQRADAVIRMGSYKVAVDAKFPLEQLSGFWESSDPELPKSVRKVFLSHAASIASKYILPREGTMPFALMYIPSENVYYRVFIAGSASLQEELLSLGVLPVGPSSLFVYLQTVAYGFRGFSFSSRSREMMHLISQIRKDYDVFSRQYLIAGTHLKNFHKAWEDSGARLSELDRNIRRLDESDPDES
ncbi:DNA recombination protein RmuC [Oceanispirochaeta sp.]|jgi:DNA recombination protein RmuC|uniref:DNA recombination protein RmuC n=1 Tax=Oceanispirochaeta sp. TaxID=2035350 RepID=UPI00261A9085|nr:DNA recombination protein RmuC [Oceanispirochaeta sp.]MDA3955847.1 DNA recombination protein RmuC [Oceanispirochaeta sp.]